jgi:hypothetical protein
VDLHFQIPAGAPVLNAHNILHFLMPQGFSITPTFLNSLCTNFRTHWGTRFASLVQSDWSLVAVQATALDGSGQVGIDTTAVAGAGGGTMMPPSACIVGSAQAGIVARGGRGRWYHPGPTLSVLTNDGTPTISTTAAGNWKTAFNGFAGDVAADSYSSNFGALCIPSYYSRGQLRSTPLTHTYSGFVVHRRLGTQRRRMGKESLYGVT